MAARWRSVDRLSVSVQVARETVAPVFHAQRAPPPPRAPPLSCRRVSQSVTGRHGRPRSSSSVAAAAAAHRQRGVGDRGRRRAQQLVDVEVEFRATWMDRSAGRGGHDRVDRLRPRVWQERTDDERQRRSTSSSRELALPLPGQSTLPLSVWLSVCRSRTILYDTIGYCLVMVTVL